MTDDQKKSSKFGLGLFIGSVIGGLAAFFFSPASGPENREMVAKKVKELEKLLEEKEIDKKVKEIFGEVTLEAKEIYLKAKKEVVKRLAELKEAVEHIDKEKYVTVVHEVVDILKKEFKKEERDIARLRNELMGEWEKLNKKSPAKKAKK